MCITSSMWAFCLQTYYNFDTSESARNVMAHVTPVLTTAGLVNTGFNPGTVIVITWSNMFGKVTEGCASVYNNQVNQDDAVTCIHRITDLLWWEFMVDRVDNFWTTDHSTQLPFKLLTIRANDPKDYWPFGQMAFQTIEHSNQWPLGILTCNVWNMLIFNWFSLFNVQTDMKFITTSTVSTE